MADTGPQPGAIDLDLFRQPTTRNRTQNHSKMLSTSTSSSIQKRRQTHRRQQSLETPILAAPLPPNRFNRAQMHRRGLSLDQPMTTLTSPIDFTTAGAANQYTERLQVSIPLEQERQPQGTQHILQDTQQQRPSQPGQLPMDFSAHLQRQLNGIDLPFMNAAEAKQQLQNHINWFQATYGEGSQSLTAVAPPEPFAYQPLSHAPLTPTQQAACLPMQSRPGQAKTVPNTPHRQIARGRTPPHTESKHSRSQSFQYDATPLTQTGGDIFNPSSFGVSVSMYSDQHSYASSNYSSSIADPCSPSYSGIMPTVPEDELLALDRTMMTGSQQLLRATMAASVTDDEIDDLHAPQPYSPRQAALLALGDINASIEETGISAQEVNQYMSTQNEHDQKWTCLFPECGKKFGRKENIRAHIQTHLGDRQFRCNDCGKCFVRQHDLKRHAKIHSGVKPNVCPCGMSFARQDALTRHRQRGTCFGVLPGFEKHEDDRKKRGRPRKERPDLESRLDKASRARQMDALAARQAMSTSGSVYHGSASSDSGASDHGSPLTPAPSSDIDDMLFNDFVSSNAGADCVPFNMPNQASWMMDTPPTSPASYHTLPKTIAPVMLSNHASPAASSSASMDDCELALLAWRGDEPQLVF